MINLKQSIQNNSFLQNSILLIHFTFMCSLTLLHSEWQKLHRVLAVLSATGLISGLSIHHLAISVWLPADENMVRFLNLPADRGGNKWYKWK